MIAAPAEVAEGEESPLETKAQTPDGSQSAAAASGAESASELPQVHAQAAPAKPATQDSTEAERTAPPAAASSSVADSASSAAEGTSSPSAGHLLLLLGCWLSCSLHVTRIQPT